MIELDKNKALSINYYVIIELYERQFCTEPCISCRGSQAGFNVCTLRDVDSHGDGVVGATGFRPEVLDQAF